MSLKSWKIWIVSICALIVTAGGTGVYALYRNLNTEWSYEYQAAQVALNHSPISHISSHSTFTDISSQEIFAGEDVFGREWYAFVSGSPWVTHSVLAAQVLPEARIRSLAEKQSVRPVNISLGYLDDAQQRTFSVSNHVVWEVYGETKGQKYEYIYYDGTTGKQVWKYMLST